MSFSHPSAESLVAFASGSLKTGARLVVDVHLRSCPTCRRNVEQLNAIGGSLLTDEAPAPLPPDALASALEALDAAPAPARLSLEQIMRRGWWLPAAPGLAIKNLGRVADADERLFLIRARGGSALPEHGHNGVERLVVLGGAFEDASGRYGKGELVERGPESQHQPIACPGEICLCLSATEGPLKLTGVARLLQPLLGV